MDLIITSGLLLALLDPSDETGTKFYPSGIDEVDKYPTNRWSSTPNPLLKMPYHFFNEQIEMCSPGIYDASIENNKIILFQGGVKKAVFNAGVEDTSKHIEIPKAYVEKGSTFMTITVFQNGQRAFSKLTFPN